MTTSRFSSRTTRMHPSHLPLGLGIKRLDPYARSPVRAHGDAAGSSDGSDPHALAPTLVRLMASDAPSPLGLFAPHTNAKAAPPGSPMARRRHHATCPPIASPRNSADDSDRAAPRPFTPTSPRLSAIRQAVPPLLSGHSTHASAIARTHRAPIRRTSCGNSPQPPPRQLRAPHRCHPLQAQTPLLWRAPSTLLATHPTTTARIRLRPELLLPLPSS